MMRLETVRMLRQALTSLNKKVSNDRFGINVASRLVAILSFFCTYIETKVDIISFFRSKVLTLQTKFKRLAASHGLVISSTAALYS
jgi:hypothetical protein